MNLAAQGVGRRVVGSILLRWIDRNHLPALTAGLSVIAAMGFSVLQASAQSSSRYPTQNRAYSQTSPYSGSYMTDYDCRTCHQVEQPMFSHPVDIFPTVGIPSEFPLESGRLVCTTCHNDEMDAHAAARAEPGMSGLLRGGMPGTAFCAQCHQSMDDSRKRSHAAIMGKAHLQWGETQNTMGGLDAESRDCMGCHDGAGAKDIGPSHPIGGVYSSSDLNWSRSHRLRPVEQLDDRIRLFDGRMGCGSCHSPYAQKDKLLVITNQQSELCVSCHR